MNKGLNYVLKLTDQVSLPLQKVKGAFSGLSKGVKAVMGIQAAFVGATGAITAFLNTNLTALDDIHQLSQVTGAGTKAIFNLGKMAEVNGSSVQAAQTSIQGLSKVIGEAAKDTGKGAKAFEMYGLSARDSNGNVKSTFAVLDDVRSKMKGLSESEQIAMLSKLGIDQSMIQVLRLSNQELTELSKKTEAYSLGAANKENAKHAAAFKDALTESKQMLQGVGQYLAVKLAPILTDVIGRFSDWYVANSQLVKNGLNKIIDLVSRFLNIGFRVISGIHQFISSTIGWENTIWALVAVFAYFKKALLSGFLFKLKAIFALAFSPLGVVIITVGALIFLFVKFKAQIMAFVGGVIAGFNKWGVSFEPIKSAISRVQEAFSRLFSPIEKATGGTEKFAKAGEILGYVMGAAFEFILTFLTYVIDGFANLAHFFVDVITSISSGWEEFTTLLSNGEWAEALSRLVKGIFQIFTNLWHNIQASGIKFINGLIEIVNKFGLNIKPIEIPVKAKVDMPEQLNSNITTTQKTVIAQPDHNGKIHDISVAKPRTMDLDKHKGVKGNMQQTNNNQRTYHITINSQNTDPKAIVNEMREAENKELGR